jgi:hypothetical protein
MRVIKHISAELGRINERLSRILDPNEADAHRSNHFRDHLQDG